MSTAMVMVFAAACSSKNTPSATASETTATVAETTQQETTKAESTAAAESLNTDEAKDSEESKADSAADQEEASMTGTISDIKDSCLPSHLMVRITASALIRMRSHRG
mgnify:CR=1 FL=1